MGGQNKIMKIKYDLPLNAAIASGTAMQTLKLITKRIIFGDRLRCELHLRRIT